jgi:hypothetical protein
MARVKTPPLALRTKQLLAERITALRIELFGARGGPELARRLGIPSRTWYNYEGGITVPGEILLRIIDVTSVEPKWLLHGTGPRFSAPGGDPSESVPSSAIKINAVVASAIKPDVAGSSKVAACTLLRAALQLLETEQLETSNHDETPARPQPIVGQTAAVDLEARFLKRNAPPYGRSSGNGTEC